jgi:NAD(P)-dependent dehydrogenase (short-subunit alcohol dehydrogenase family)
MTTRQTILVAGATGNIGGGTAIALAKRGANVVLLGRNVDKLNAVTERVRNAVANDQDESLVPDISTLVMDLSDMGSVRQATADALDRFPEINCLVVAPGTWRLGWDIPIIPIEPMYYVMFIL